MNDNLFKLLMKRGHILKHEDGERGLSMKFRLDAKIFILYYTSCHDLSEAWEYTITDKFGNVLVTNQYTKIL